MVSSRQGPKSCAKNTALDAWAGTKMAPVTLLTSVDITHLLKAWGDGDESALNRLTPLVYAHLREQARRYMRRERSGVTLQSTALVHEVYLRLVNTNEVACKDRGHFFALASQIMRRILVDAARFRAAAKRGGAIQTEHSPSVDIDQLTRLVGLHGPLCARRRPRELDANRSAASEGHRTAVLRRPERRRDCGGSRRVTADSDA